MADKMISVSAATYAEMKVQTVILSRILRTLNEVAFKLQDSTHVMSKRAFDDEELEKAILEIRLEALSLFPDENKE